MAAPRRKISKEERKHRDALMNCVKWATLLCLRRMIEAGWSNSRIADVYDRMSKDIGDMVVSNAEDESGLCGDSHDIADMVFCFYEKERVFGQAD